MKTHVTVRKLVPFVLLPALLGTAGVAAAQGWGTPQGQGYYVEGPGRGGRPLRRDRALEASPARVCVPWCAHDQNPCDPPEFKRADGRCFGFDEF